MTPKSTTHNIHGAPPPPPGTAQAQSSEVSSSKSLGSTNQSPSMAKRSQASGVPVAG